MRRYQSVVLDADMTIFGIEGIDWLAARRDAAVQQQVVALTTRAMNGELRLEEVYDRRLALIAPTADDFTALAAAYAERVAPGAPDAVAALHAAGVAVHVISGGLRPALLPALREIGIAEGFVHAVEPELAADGIARSARPTPLTTQSGKLTVLRGLTLQAPVLAVGDGATDAALAPAVDAFAAYIGFVRRDAVVSGATLVLDSFASLVAHVLSA